jgi:Cu2+-exporting ATPase
MLANLADNGRPTVIEGEACFHCGLALDAGRWRASVGDRPRAFCCAGCAAIAQTLEALDATSVYASRARARFARPRPPAPLDAATAAAVATASIRTLETGNREAALFIDGLRCGACAALIERWLERLPGVERFRVNYTTARATVVWREPGSTLAEIVGSVIALGYGAHPYDPARREAAARREQRALLLRASIALLMMMQVMMLAAPSYMSDDGVEPLHRAILEWGSLVLTLPVVLYCALPFYQGAARAWRNRQLNMDVPVVLGTVAAFVASVDATLRGEGAVYYDSVTMFIALLLGARYLELSARLRAAAAIEASARESPLHAERIAGWPAHRAVESVAAAALQRGEHVLVRPGATVPADGEIVEGVSSIEEAVLTGEVRPVERGPGARVLAGAVNASNALVVRVVAAGDATQLAGIVRLAERAAAARPRAAQMSDRVARRFVGALLVIAAATALAWTYIDAERAVAITFAVLVVSCPCALSLATPSALAAAAGALARRRVMLVGDDALESLACATHVVFDKTGTLTCGAFRVATTWTREDSTAADAHRLAAALEACSEHPIARAFTEAFAGPEASVPIARLAVITGAGIEALVNGVVHRIGSPAFVAELAGPLPAAAVAFLAGAPGSSTIVALGTGEGVQAVFTLDDTLREGAREAIASLRDQGMTPLLLSGDRASAVRLLGDVLGIGDARGDQSPAAKLEAVRALQQRGAVVAMVGDGVNDAPALARADVSLSLATATAIAQSRADVVVLGDDLRRIPEIAAHARRTLRILRQNLGWALVYNLIAIPAAALGFVTPLTAAAGMSLSSLAVVANSLRAARIRPGRG